MFQNRVMSQIQLQNIEQLTVGLTFDSRFLTVLPTFVKLTSLTINILPRDCQSSIQSILDRSPHLQTLKFSSWTTMTKPPYRLLSPSIRRLDLEGRDQHREKYSYNAEQCVELSRSPLGRQCQVLTIQVKHVACIALFMLMMRTNLRILQVNVEGDDMFQEDNLVKILQESIPSNWNVTRSYNGNLILRWGFLNWLGRNQTTVQIERDLSQQRFFPKNIFVLSRISLLRSHFKINALITMIDLLLPLSVKVHRWRLAVLMRWRPNLDEDQTNLVKKERSLSLRSRSDQEDEQRFEYVEGRLKKVSTILLSRRNTKLTSFADQIRSWGSSMLMRGLRWLDTDRNLCISLFLWSGCSPAWIDLSLSVCVSNRRMIFCPFLTFCRAHNIRNHSTFPRSTRRCWTRQEWNWNSYRTNLWLIYSNISTLSISFVHLRIAIVVSTLCYSMPIERIVLICVRYRTKISMISSEDISH